MSSYCVISGEITDLKIKQYPISKNVLDYAKWYRDKINSNTKKNISLMMVIKMFNDMKSKAGSFNNIKDKLDIELKQKGYLNENELRQKFNC